jgi:hypothetical protein
MPSSPQFSPRLLGQTEKGLNAILARLLAGSGLTEPQWVTLNIAATMDESLRRPQFTSRVAGVFKVDDEEAYTHVAALIERGFLALEADDVIAVTDAGRTFRSAVADQTADVTERLWGDLPVEELDTAARVLGTVLSRVEGELARH